MTNSKYPARTISWKVHYVEWLIYASALLLYISSGAKVIGLAHPNTWAQKQDVVLGITNMKLYASVAVLESLVALFLVIRPRARLALGALTAFTACALVYRIMAAVMNQANGACKCFGGLVGTWSGKQSFEGDVAMGILMFLAAVCMVAWHEKWAPDE